MDLPRVTEILRYYTSYDKVPPEILNRAAARGTSVHALCAGLAKGAWIPDGMIAEDLQGYVNSFKLWMQAQVSKFIVVEKRYVDEDLGFTGQLDFVVIGSDDQLYLVDIKTSSKPQKTYAIQLAAYDHLLRIHKIQVKAAILVYLDKEGEFPEINIFDNLTEEQHIFRCALDCYNFFNRKKGKKNERKSIDRSTDTESAA